MALAKAGLTAHGSISGTEDVKPRNRLFQTIRLHQQKPAIFTRRSRHCFDSSKKHGRRKAGHVQRLECAPVIGEYINRHNIAKKNINRNADGERGESLPAYRLQLTEARGKADAQEAENERPSAQRH